MMKPRLIGGRLVLGAILSFGIGAAAPQANQGATKASTTELDGTVHIAAYNLPLSLYMSEDARRSYIKQRLVAPPDVAPTHDIRKVRENVDTILLGPQLQRVNAIYPATVSKELIGGVGVYVIDPKLGIAPENTHRVLINLHGGGFDFGAGVLQLIESIPIASIMKIKVISVDYRLSPENKFPAAVEDVAAVYKILVTSYAPRNIGIYGHSVGASLVAMSLVWFQKESLPRPGAIGMFSPSYVNSGGDSRYMAAPMTPVFGAQTQAPPAAPNPPPPSLALDYFSSVDLTSPLVSPTLYQNKLAQFPATLLITGSRDPFASSTFETQRQLTNAGVDAELHVWDGMWHGFIQEVDLPEAKEMFRVAAMFFDGHLGR